jgi:hypothetical protein
MMGALDPLITYEKGTYIGESTCIASFACGCDLAMLTRPRNGHGEWVVSEESTEAGLIWIRQGLPQGCGNRRTEYHPWRQVGHPDRWGRAVLVGPLVVAPTEERGPLW